MQAKQATVQRRSPECSMLFPTAEASAEHSSDRTYPDRTREASTALRYAVIVQSVTQPAGLYLAGYGRGPT